MRLPLAFYGQKILRTHCKSVTVFDVALRELVENMVETMDAARGIGIAAPQVRQDLRLFVLRNYIEGEEKGGALSSEYYVYINPKILWVSKEKMRDVEGCLSIPGIREEVDRPYAIGIEAMDLEGKIRQEEWQGYNARVRLHENDHLNGVLFIDRIDKSRRKKIDPLLQKIEKSVSLH